MAFGFRLAVGLVASAVCVLASDPAKAPAGSFTVVEIDGVKFTAADVLEKKSASVFQARNSLFEAERKAADEFVTDYLLERQAKKENCTVADLLKRHVDSVANREISDDALRVYYDGVDTAEPFEAVKDKIIDAIRTRRATKAKAAYLQSLRSQANVAVRLVAPRVNLSLKDTPVRGPADAPVTVVEYADYECPYCQQIQPAIDKIEAEYKGRLAFAYKDVPLPNHANAAKATEASHCAGDQGKYWEYHDLLYSTKQLSPGKLADHARALQLDVGAFEKCLASGVKAEISKAHIAEAQAVALPGTPGIFVNGRFINGAVDYQTLRQIVEEELHLTLADRGGKAVAQKQVK